MIKTRKKTRQEIQTLQELRRSSASQPHRNKAKYSRKPKHRSRLTTDY